MFTALNANPILKRVRMTSRGPSLRELVMVAILLLGLGLVFSVRLYYPICLSNRSYRLTDRARTITSLIFLVPILFSMLAAVTSAVLFSRELKTDIFGNLRATPLSDRQIFGGYLWGYFFRLRVLYVLYLVLVVVSVFFMLFGHLTSPSLELVEDYSDSNSEKINVFHLPCIEATPYSPVAGRLNRFFRTELVQLYFLFTSLAVITLNIAQAARRRTVSISLMMSTGLVILLNTLIVGVMVISGASRFHRSIGEIRTLSITRLLDLGFNGLYSGHLGAFNIPMLITLVILALPIALSLLFYRLTLNNLRTAGE